MQYADIMPQGLETEHFHKRIHCRSGHITVLYRDFVLVWGGSREVYYDNGTRHEYHDTGEIMMYNCFTEVWTRLIASGDIPLRNSGAAAVILGDCLYVFGGFQLVFDDDYGQTIESPGNTLHQLDLRTLVWKELHPSGVCPSPCDKLVGWEYGEKLYFFGGFGPAPQNLANVPFMYIECSNGDNPHRGWNNQFLCYDPEENNWSWPATKGPTPLPRAAHAADIRNGKAYIFGGRLLDDRVNALFCLDMEAMRWTDNLTNLSDETPEARSWHSFTFINDTTAIAYGGFSQQNMILNDCWRLIVSAKGYVIWQEIPLAYDHGHPRFLHSSCAGRPGELIIHGGYVQPYYQLSFLHQELADSLLTLNFQPKSLFRICIKASLSYFRETSGQWSMLPKTVERTLKQRLEQL